jgi:hypothetical protein
MAAQEAGYPDINIICEKVATEGETRFEDRYRLPVGISVNMTSFSAKCAPFGSASTPLLCCLACSRKTSSENCASAEHPSSPTLVPRTPSADNQRLIVDAMRMLPIKAIHLQDQRHPQGFECRCVPGRH